MNIQLHFPQRKSVHDPVPNFTISFNDKSMVVDEQKLPPKLVKLMPVPYCKAHPEDWYPFCVLATAMGLMK